MPFLVLLWHSKVLTTEVLIIEMTGGQEVKCHRFDWFCDIIFGPSDTSTTGKWGKSLFPKLDGYYV